MAEAANNGSGITVPSVWQNNDRALFDLIETEREQRLQAYRAKPRDVDEHVNIEASLQEAGYRDRQVVELVQNATDAARGLSGEGRVQVLLTEDCLYVANNGAPLTQGGIDSLLQSHLSEKRDALSVGRFGLGFKSLLGLSRDIAILSQSVSLKFDEHQTRSEIARILPDRSSSRVPLARLAWAVPASDLLKNDPAALALADWAVTIVRARLSSTDRIVQQLEAFPPEFPLFSGGVQLDISFKGETRSYSATAEADDSVRWLAAGGNGGSWRVVTKDIVISDEDALADAGELHARTTHRLTWAIPQGEKKVERGRFWASFPLAVPAPIPGILNAPWKTDNNRSAIVPGAFNDALMKELAKLVVETLPSLKTDDDPAVALDYLPRRDPGSDAGLKLADAIWARAKGVAIVPDGDGTLCEAAKLRQHPETSQEAILAWHAIACAQRGLHIHPSCLHRERRARLIELGVGQSTPLHAWLASAASTKTPNSAKSVLVLVELVEKSKLSREDRELVREARVVLSADGEYYPASASCIADPSIEVPDGMARVHGLLAEDPESRRVLEQVLHVSAVKPEQWVRALHAHVAAFFRHQRTDPTAQEWEMFWAELLAMLRRAPSAIRAPFLKKLRAERPIRVRCCDGSWKHVGHVVAVGTIVSAEDAKASANAGYVVDEAFYAADRQLLGDLQIADGARQQLDTADLANAPVWKTFHQKALERFVETLSSGQNPQQHYLRFLDPRSVHAPLSILVDGTEIVRTRITASLLRQVGESHAPATFGHATSAGKYPSTQEIHPLSWLLATHGLLQVENVFLKVGELLSLTSTPWLAGVLGQDLTARLRFLEQGFPYPRPPLRGTSLWPSLFAIVNDAHCPVPVRIGVYESAAAAGVVPERIWVMGGERPIFEVLVVERGTHGESSELSMLPVLSLGASACKAFVARGAGSFDAQSPPLCTPLEDPLPLVEYEPFLASLVTPGAREVRIQRVRDLHRVVANESIGMMLFRQGTLIFVDEERYLASEAARSGDAFVQLCRSLFDAGWLSVPAEEAVERFKKSDAIARRAAVAAGDVPLSTRLLRAVGNNVTHLLARLAPEVASLLQERQASPDQIADVFLNSWGPGALAELQPVLSMQNLLPPPRWRPETAVAFVESLGFPSIYGGTAESRREPSLDVEGPIPLGELHNFQRDVQNELLGLLKQTGRRRALVNLPTGAGKTRVAVQTIVQALCDGLIKSPVLWIAQSDELCEQAVSCFRDVWANFGTARTTLKISRVWGGISRHVDSHARLHIVVASIQTLSKRLDAGQFDWLREAGAVVIDEAHHAVASSYSSLVRWLERDEPDEPPILGLTATAFRGFNERETTTLANRFGRRIIPVSPTPEELMRSLQQRGVLAEVDFCELASEVEVDFVNDHERALFKQFDEVPPSVLERLANDVGRNQLVVNDIVSRPPGTRALVFALSVKHARMLAAELTLAGWTAASIDASTAPVTRRHLISAFRDGSVPVLVNYGVLTTGFDAPMTDVILIARPTFSPNLYQQMIGRGLRGEKNGGKARCTLVTVVDNFERFGRQLAFAHFRNLFTLSSVSPEAERPSPVDLGMCTAVTDEGRCGSPRQAGYPFCAVHMNES